MLPPKRSQTERPVDNVRVPRFELVTKTAGLFECIQCGVTKSAIIFKCYCDRWSFQHSLHWCAPCVAAYEKKTGKVWADHPPFNDKPVPAYLLRRNKVAEEAAGTSLIEFKPPRPVVVVPPKPAGPPPEIDLVL
jgi:hypothetical protein